MELISYFAIEASCELAKERGTYETYKGSLWDNGIFPLDSINLRADQRGSDFIDQNTDKTLDWDKLKEKMAKHGRVAGQNNLRFIPAVKFMVSSKPLLKSKFNTS